MTAILAIIIALGVDVVASGAIILYAPGVKLLIIFVGYLCTLIGFPEIAPNYDPSDGLCCNLALIAIGIIFCLKVVLICIFYFAMEIRHITPRRYADLEKYNPKTQRLISHTRKSTASLRRPRWLVRRKKVGNLRRSTSAPKGKAEQKGNTRLRT